MELDLVSPVRVAQLVLGLGSLGAAPTPANGQQAAPICREHDHNAVWLLARVRRYTEAREGDDAIVRDSLRLPSMPGSEVRLVSDETVCRRAALTYFGLLNRNLDTVSGRVYLLQAQERYVVVDPTWRYSLQRRRLFVAILDQEFRSLRFFQP
jgi:hypothetical protein